MSLAVGGAAGRSGGPALRRAHRWLDRHSRALRAVCAGGAVLVALTALQPGPRRVPTPAVPGAAVAQEALAGTSLVATPVRLADPALAATVHPGEQVDVFDAASARTLATGVRVLSVLPAGDATATALAVLATSVPTAARLAALPGPVALSVVP